MSIEYLEEIEQAIDHGVSYFVCRGATAQEWHLSTKLDALKEKAKRAATASKMPTTIYRLILKEEAVPGISFLVVRKFLEAGRSGEPRMQWALVDTREAAEMLRDVSHGPSPFFGAVEEVTLDP